MTNPQPLIGISGRKRAGKDTLASFLVNDHAFTRLAFADPLKAIVGELNPIIGYRNGFQRVRDALALHGPERIKDEWPEYRRLLQVHGDAVRRHIGPTVWVDALISKVHWHLAEGKPVVISDVRFPNEADRIKDLGGIVVRVNRPGTADGTGSNDLHISETALDDYEFDQVIDNNRSTDSLREIAKSLAIIVGVI